MGLSIDDRGTDNRVEVHEESVRGEVGIELDGRRNRIEIASDLQTVYPVRVLIEGDDNRITLGEGLRLLGAADNPMQRTRITVAGNRNRVAFGRACSGGFGVKITAHDAEVVLGGDCTAVMARFQLLESARISVGEDCMMSVNVIFQASDGHPIFDRETGARVNPAKDIRIGDHVWLGAGVRVLKGVEIGSGSVIGANSTVTSSIPAHCVAAGAPARVVRENVEWRRNELQFSARVRGTVEL